MSYMTGATSQTSDLSSWTKGLVTHLFILCNVLLHLIVEELYAMFDCMQNLFKERGYDANFAFLEWSWE